MQYSRFLLRGDLIGYVVLVDTGGSSHPASYAFSLAEVFYGGSASFSISLSSGLFRDAGFVSGSRVAVVAYADGYSSTSYADPVTKRLVFTSLNPRPSNVISVMVP